MDGTSLPENTQGLSDLVGPIAGLAQMEKPGLRGREAEAEEEGVKRNGDKLSHPFRLPHRRVGRRGRERHRTPGRRRGPSSREGNVPGRMSALARDINDLAPRHTSN